MQIKSHFVVILLGVKRRSEGAWIMRIEFGDMKKKLYFCGAFEKTIAKNDL